MVVTPTEMRIESVAHYNETRKRSCHAGEMANANL